MIDEIQPGQITMSNRRRSTMEKQQKPLDNDTLTTLAVQQAMELDERTQALQKAMAEILAQLTARCDGLEQKIKDVEKRAVDWTMEHDTIYTARVRQTDERIERLETIIHQQDDEIRQMSARIRALTTPEDPAECGIGYPLVPAAGLDMISHQEYMAMEETET